MGTAERVPFPEILPTPTFDQRVLVHAGLAPRCARYHAEESQVQGKHRWRATTVPMPHLPASICLEHF